MKAAIVYDSYFGNTKRVAEAIAEELRTEGHESELLSVRDRSSAPPEADVIFLGSPVRMGSVTGKVKKYVKKLGNQAWGSKPIIAFTTTLQLADDATDKQRESQEKYDRAAGRRLGELARSLGLNAPEDRLWVEVEGMKGPLVVSGIEKTREFVRDLLRNL